jgi:hypothetical protein
MKRNVTRTYAIAANACIPSVLRRGWVSRIQQIKKQKALDGNNREKLEEEVDTRCSRESHVEVEKSGKGFDEDAVLERSMHDDFAVQKASELASL